MTSRRKFSTVLVAAVGLLTLVACNPKAISDPVSGGCSTPSAISNDGRYVVVSAPGDPIVIRDSQTVTDLAVLPSGIAQAMSNNAEVVTYQDDATNSARYWRRSTGTSTTIAKPAGTVATWVGSGSVSADGTQILFAARTITGSERLYLHDVASGTSQFVPDSTDAQGKISANGRYVAYLSSLVVKRYDRIGHSVVDLALVDNLALEPIKAISGDGRVVLFNYSQAGFEEQIDMWDESTGSTEWAPFPGNGDYSNVRVDLDTTGQVITWSLTSPLGAVFQYDRATSTTTEITPSSTGSLAFASGDGMKVAYCGSATESGNTVYKTFLWTRPSP